MVLDQRFAKIKLGNSPIKRLHTGMLWAEGPAWNGVGNYLVWSDIPNDVQLRWIEDDGHVSVMRRPAGNSNGNTFDREGRQISCEHGNRRVVRYEYDGKITVLADRFGGKPLNAPNDPVVHPDGGIWFTDPGYGALSDYEGHKGALEIKEAVYRIDPASAKLDKVTDDLFKPNGLCFSPDYKTLYIADTGASHYPEAPRNIRAYDVVDAVKLARGREFASMKMDAQPAASGPALPTASAPTPRATSTRPPAGSVPAMTASTCSPPTACASARSCCRRSAPTCASAGRSATACSWQRASRSTPSTSIRAALTSRERLSRVRARSRRW